MIKYARSLFTVCALTALEAMAGQFEMTVVELAIEASPQAVVLPSVPDGTLVVTPCVGCAPLSLRATAKSQYLIGSQNVSLVQLRETLRTRRDAQLVVLYTKDSKVLTRVIASVPVTVPNKSR